MKQFPKTNRLWQMENELTKKHFAKETWLAGRYLDLPGEYELVQLTDDQLSYDGNSPHRRVIDIHQLGWAEIEGKMAFAVRKARLIEKDVPGIGMCICQVAPKLVRDAKPFPLDKASMNLRIAAVELVDALLRIMIVAPVVSG